VVHDSGLKKRENLEEVNPKAPKISSKIFGTLWYGFSMTEMVFDIHSEEDQFLEKI